MKKILYFILRFLCPQPYPYWEYKFGYIEKDGTPIECPYCGCRNFRREVKDQIACVDCEVEYTCAQCERFRAFWAYGYFQYRIEE